MRESTLRELATITQSQLEGDDSLLISEARGIRDTVPGCITYLDSDKHGALLAATQAAAVVAGPGTNTGMLPTLRCADPFQAFIAIVKHFHGRPEQRFVGLDPRSDIHPSAQIGPGTSIHAFASVGKKTAIGTGCRLHSGVSVGRFCKIGDEVILYPNVVLYDGTIIGDRTVIHANAVIGADGFGYRSSGGKHGKVPQQGHVEIGADVEIGACTTIDRGTFGATRIGEGTKIDNLVQVGHNCQIGKHNLLVSQMGIAGSSSTGCHVVIAGQVGVVDHVHIGDGCIIGGQAAVTKDVPAGLRMLGSPATPEREQKRIMMSLQALPDMRREVQKIKDQLGMNETPRKTA